MLEKKKKNKKNQKQPNPPLAVSWEIGLVCYGFECFLRLFSVPVRNTPLLRPGSVKSCSDSYCARRISGTWRPEGWCVIVRVGLFVCFFNENHRYLGKGRNKEVFLLSGALSYI